MPTKNKLALVTFIIILFVILLSVVIYDRNQRYTLQTIPVQTIQKVIPITIPVSPTEAMGAKTGDEVLDRDTQDALNSLDKAGQ